MNPERRQQPRPSRDRQPEVLAGEGLDPQEPPHERQPGQVGEGQRQRSGDGRPLHPQPGSQDGRHGDVQRHRRRVHDEVPPRPPHHDQDEPDAAGAHVHDLPDEQDAERRLPLVEVAAEQKEHRSGHRHQQDQQRERHRERPARQLLEQVVQARPLAAGVEVGHERAEHVVDGDDEKQKELGRPNGRRVDAHLLGGGVARQHEEIGPEQHL